MKKIIFLLFTVSIFAGPFLSTAASGEIEIIIKDFQCEEDGKLVVRYGLNSTFDFDYQNVTVGFKIEEGEKTIACSETKLEVPKGSDGSQVNEVIINLPCIDKNYKLKSAVFYYIKRYRIDEWFSDCN